MAEEYGSDFDRGDIIEFCGDRYEVIKNYGNSGLVREHPDGDIIAFYWVFQGTKCTIVKKHDDR